MDTRFLEAVRQLHRRKDAAYRDAWKKRGEVLGILANVARKVDRLEYVLDGALATQDESLFDTAVDLLVYTLKYQTYLADQDECVAITLFTQSDIAPPYSDGPTGFESLLDRIRFMDFSQANGMSTKSAVSDLNTAFADIEVYIEVGMATPVTIRAERAARLTHATALLVSSLMHENPDRYDNFLHVNLEGE